MRVALINPRFRLPIDTRTAPHLGLAYLGAVSERRGDEVRVYDADVEEQRLADFLHEFRPHIVGITANTPQVKQAWRTAAAVKQELDVPIVLGGPHVSVVSEELDYESLRQSGVDLVVRGEGELSWVAICDRLDGYLRDAPTFSTAALMDSALDLFSGLANVSYKTADGALRRNPDGPVVEDLDSLPWPAYHLFKMERYTNLQPATDAVDGAAQLLADDQPGLPVSLHVLLAEHHAHQVARPLAGERARGMAPPRA